MKKLETAFVVTAVLLIPGTSAFAAAPEAAGESAAAPATEPAPAAEPEPAAAPAQEEPQPAATPAQSPDDVSGGNEYSEQAPPTGTGEPETPDTPAPDDTDDTPTQQAAPTGGGTTSAPTAVAADTTDSEATDGLPRTGSEGLIITLIGIALVGSGILLRRVAVPLR